MPGAEDEDTASYAEQLTKAVPAFNAGKEKKESPDSISGN